MCCERYDRIGAAGRIARRHLYKSAVFPPPVSRRPAGTAAGRDPTSASPDLAAGDAPGVAVGTVLDVSPHVLVIDSPDGERRFALSPGASAWRGKPADPTALRAGDTVVVRRCAGRRDTADRMWAGIGRVTGTIIARDADRLLVEEGMTRPRQSVVISSTALSRIQVRFPQLGPGHLIDVIGVRRGPVLEALLPATSQPATSQPAYQAGHLPRRSPVRGPGPRSISGAATWHEPTGPASTADGLAYPAIDPAAGCAEDGGQGAACASLPYLAIGSMLVVHNQCTGMSRTLPVSQCASAARLFCDRCITCGTSARARIADLALASFIRLGGEPERGCFNAVLAIGW